MLQVCPALSSRACFWRGIQCLQQVLRDPVWLTALDPVPRTARDDGGVTLIEVMIVLSLIVILSLFIIPSFRQQVDKTTDTIAQTQLIQQLQHAQQIANSKTINVTVCLSQDNRTCSENSGSSVLMFAENKLIASTVLKGRGTLHLRSYPVYRNYILMKPTVMANSDNGTFWYCSQHHVFQWALAVSQSGEAHVITNSPSENPLGC